MTRNRKRVTKEESIADAKRRGLVPQSGDWQNPKRWIRPNPELCIHHWSIESSNGPASIGECQKCHAKRKFLNSITAGETWGGLIHLSIRSQEESTE